LLGQTLSSFIQVLLLSDLSTPRDSPQVSAQNLITLPSGSGGVEEYSILKPAALQLNSKSAHWFYKQLFALLISHL
jgi:hypothetical protein